MTTINIRRKYTHYDNKNSYWNEVFEYIDSLIENGESKTLLRGYFTQKEEKELYDIIINDYVDKDSIVRNDECLKILAEDKLKKKYLNENNKNNLLRITGDTG